MPTPRPLIVAHRGSSRSFPENTFAAFDAAVLANVDAIELDLQMSKDGIPVVFHDKTLRRTHKERAKIHHRSLDELRQLDFGAWFHTKRDPQPIPTLDDVLVRYGRQVTLMLELKTDTDTGDGAEERAHALASAVVDAVRKRKWQRRVWILGFDADVLKAARKRDEKIQCALGVAEPVEPGRALAKRLEPFQALLLPGRNVSRALVDAVRSTGRAVIAYRCDAARVAGKVVRAGADALMADDPIWLENFVDSVISQSS